MNCRAARGRALNLIWEKISRQTLAKLNDKKTKSSLSKSDCSRETSNTRAETKLRLKYQSLEMVLTPDQLLEKKEKGLFSRAGNAKLLQNTKDSFVAKTVALSKTNQKQIVTEYCRLCRRAHLNSEAYALYRMRRKIWDAHQKHVHNLISAGVEMQVIHELRAPQLPIRPTVLVYSGSWKTGPSGLRSAVDMETSKAHSQSLDSPSWNHITGSGTEGTSPGDTRVIPRGVLPSTLLFKPIQAL
jgi:hypothetical protein